MYYEVIASGSKGNSVLIDDVMVDIGIPFGKLKPYLYKVKYIIITHIHTDHLKMTTYKQIKKLFPYIKFIGNWQVAQTVQVDYIANAGYQIITDDYVFNPIELVHDVVCYGYWWQSEYGNIIYATDTNNMDNAPDDVQFDYIFLESNHSESKIKKAKATRGYDPKISALRHLSTFKSKEFYYTHRRDATSEWIELHKSERFY